MADNKKMFMKGLLGAVVPFYDASFSNKDFGEKYLNELNSVVDYYYGSQKKDTQNYFLNSLDGDEERKKYKDKFKRGSIDYKMINGYFGTGSIFGDYDTSSIPSQIKTTLGEFSVKPTQTGYLVRDNYDFSPAGGLLDIPSKIVNAKNINQAIYDSARTIGGLLMPEDGSSTSPNVLISLNRGV
jgi:hypothetical protein